MRNAIVALIVGMLAGPLASVAQDFVSSAALGPNTYVVPGAGQGGVGDLVRIAGGTVEGVHVIQGGTIQCIDTVEQPPCSRSGIRRLSLNLDVGAGSSAHRGVLAVNFDVGRLAAVFDGHRHPGIRVGYDRRHNRPRVALNGTVTVNGKPWPTPTNGGAR